MKTTIFSKAIALLVTFFCINIANAQTNWNNLPYTDYTDFKFQQLDKSQIPTGILYDRVFFAVVGMAKPTNDVYLVVGEEHLTNGEE